MGDKRYIITIKESCHETRVRGKDWSKGGDGDPEKFGYTPEIEKTVLVEREIFSQNTDELDLIAVIKAINKID